MMRLEAGRLIFRAALHDRRRTIAGDRYTESTFDLEGGCLSTDVTIQLYTRTRSSRYYDWIWFFSMV